MIEAIAGPRPDKQGCSFPQSEAIVTQEQMRQANQLVTLGWRPGGRNGQCMMTEDERRVTAPCPIWTAPDGTQHAWDDAVKTLKPEKANAEGDAAKPPALDPRD